MIPGSLHSWANAGSRNAHPVNDTRHVGEGFSLDIARRDAKRAMLSSSVANVDMTFGNSRLISP